MIVPKIADSRSAQGGPAWGRELGIIGLGKMGGGIAKRLLKKGWKVHGYDMSVSTVRELAASGMEPAASLPELVAQLPQPRLVWLMVPAGKTVDAVLFGEQGIAKKLSRGDVVIDGGNSFYKDSIRRAKKLSALGITFIDVGFSGGPGGARQGGCLMVGGNEADFRRIEPLYRDLALEDGYRFFKGVGAGHFVKMVHNGIEYGMMQALAEGFAILKKSKYKPDLAKVAESYNHGSVVESRLVGWLESAYRAYGENLAAISGTVGHSGEGEWTATTARELKVPATIIEESFKFRVRSAKKPSYTGKVLSALRNQFGGHSIKPKKK
jgi:6-phosphogluconate dehydrogenase